MRVDVVSIFPAYLDALSLSLPGKARDAGLLDLRVHDLRDWTHDRHRTVDDAPYGGGAGMVMRPEPWGEALAALAGPRTVLVVPTPSGRPFTQAVAEELAGEQHVVVACGRYEGIDQRVVDVASERMRVVELSVGDYVLNGGEAAALVVLEATIRLLPGFMGNAASLTEESHGDEGLLEYPVYTRPPVWEGRAVPDVLLSGDHARVAAWRREQSLRRTAERRPDLLHRSQVVPGDLFGGEAVLRPAARGDVGELWTLQRAAWAVAAAGGEPSARARVAAEPSEIERRVPRTLVVHGAGRLVASVSAWRDEATWWLDDLAVVPDLQGRGVGSWLLAAAARRAPVGTAAVSARVPAAVGLERALRRAGLRRRAADGDLRLWQGPPPPTP